LLTCLAATSAVLAAAQKAGPVHESSGGKRYCFCDSMPAGPRRDDFLHHSNPRPPISNRKVIKNLRFLYPGTALSEWRFRHEATIFSGTSLQEKIMLDLIYIVILIASFAGLAALAVACERL
jgi:hypothetical protein